MNQLLYLVFYIFENMPNSKNRKLGSIFSQMQKIPLKIAKVLCQKQKILERLLNLVTLPLYDNSGLMEHESVC